ncbi:hypothetical protein PHYC_02439 [Phycisphaerales bacterium]|nr:hypothetical protein PHYC_02439 [Phycisphaerales bacterium]
MNGDAAQTAGATPAAPGEEAVAPPSWARRMGEALKPANLAWAIPGPIFHKEMWLAGRRTGTYWIRGIYTVLLLALVSLVYAVSRAESQGSPSQRLQQFQSMAPIVAYSMAWFQMVALPLAAIIFGAPAISDEKRAGTLGTLLTTPLRAWQIVLGKLTSTLVQLVVLALISTPLLLAMRLFGGITGEFVFAVQSLTISGAVLAGSLAVFHSIGAKRSPSAAAAALVLFLASQGICPLVVFLLSRSGLGIVDLAPQWYVMFCPPAVMGLVLVEMRSAGSPIPVSLAWPLATGYNLLLAMMLFIAAAARLRSVLRKEGEAGAAIPSGGPVQESAVGEPAGLPGAPAVRKRQKSGSRRRAGQESREVLDRPVYWREALQPTFRRRWHGFLLGAVVAGSLIWLYVKLGWQHVHSEGVHFPIAVAGCGMTLLLAVFGSSTLISGERESRTWDALLATPMSARDLIWSKFGGFLRRQWLVPAVVFGHFGLMSVLGIVDWRVMLLLPIVYGAPLAATAATGVLFSTIIKKSVRAAAANFAIWLGVWGVLPVLGGILSIGVRDPDGIFAAIGFFNPFGLSVVTMTGLVRSLSGPRNDGFDYYGFGSDLSFLEFGGLLFGYAAFHAGVVFVALRIAARHIADATARAT